MATIYQEAVTIELSNPHLQGNLSIGCSSRSNFNRLPDQSLSDNSDQETKLTMAVLQHSRPAIAFGSSSRAPRYTTSASPAPIYIPRAFSMRTQSKPSTSPASRLIEARKKLIIAFPKITEALNKRLSETYTIRQNSLLFSAADSDPRSYRAWRKPGDRQAQREHVAERKERPNYSTSYARLGEAGSIHKKKLKHSHAELSKMLKDRCLTKVHDFLMQFKAEQQTNETFQKGSGKWGSSRRSFSSMCILCELIPDKICCRHVGEG